MSADVWIVRDRCNACGRGGLASEVVAAALTMLDKSRRWKSIASLTAERDSLAARLALVEALAEAEVERLTAERDALAQITRHIDEVRNGAGWTVQIYGVLLQQCDQYGKTIDTRRAERAEAERDALAAQVARVEKLAEEWRYKGQFGWGPWQIGEGPDPEGYVMDHCASALRAALADSEADTSDTQPTDQEVSDE